MSYSGAGMGPLIYFRVFVIQDDISDQNLLALGNLIMVIMLSIIFTKFSMFFDVNAIS